MHPAVSVIFFTVVSGVGFGLMFFMGLGWPMAASGWSAFLSACLAGGLAVAGLVASTFHLGHPERAIKAFSQWRSSWLSREGVLAVVTLVLFGIYSLLWTFYGVRSGVLGLLISALCAATVFATSMIYAQLKTVPHWKTNLTPICFLAFSFATGLLMAALLSGNASLIGIPIAVFAIAGIVVAWAVKFAWWNRADNVGFSETGSDTGTATGLGSLGKVKLLEKPHSGENYLTKEMVHQIGRKHADKLRKLALVVGGALPIVFCLAALIGILPLFCFALAIISMIAGLFAERWLFFAEAKHAVSLYY